MGSKPRPTLPTDAFTLPARYYTEPAIFEREQEKFVRRLWMSVARLEDISSPGTYVTRDIAGLKRVARKNGWRLSKAKKGFLVQGTDRIGAVQAQLARLASGKVNVVAADAVAAGQGRYGMILWVRPGDYARAARALRAR